MPRITNNFSNHLSIGWELTSTCNFSCWYCPDYLHDGKYKWPDLEKSLHFFEQLSKTKDTIYLDLVGGEPTLWPKLSEFLQRRPSNIFVEVTTNGSRTLNWWNNNSKYIDLVTISFHANTADPDHTIELCKLLVKNGVKKIFVWILAVADKVDICKYLYEQLDQLELPIDVITKPIYNVHGVNKQSEIKLNNSDVEVINILKYNKFNRSTYDMRVAKPVKVFLDNKPFNYVLAEINKQNDFYGWTCTAGINRLFIHKDGSIVRGSCGVGGIIGNINKDFILPTDPIVCNSTKTCRCIDEIKLEKWKD